MKSVTIVLCAAVFFMLTSLISIDSYGLIGLKEGDAPPPFTLNDINGESVDVTQQIGKKPVIIVFWELSPDKSFLNYSLDELIFLNDSYGKYHEKTGLEIFGIYTPEEENEVSDRELAEVKGLLKTNGINFPVLIDRGFKIFREYGVIALPSTVMVGKTGKIDFIYPSFPLSAMPVFAEKIPELTGMQEVRKHEVVKTTGKDSQAVRLYHYALQMYKRGLMEQAVSPLNKSMSLDPDFAMSHNLMGIILWEAGNIDSARNAFSRAIALDKSSAPAHLNYGVIHFETEAYGEAEKYFKAAIALNASLAEAHYALGQLYSRTDNIDGALMEFETALGLFDKRKAVPVAFDPVTYNSISALVEMSQLHLRSGKENMCMKSLQKAAQTTLGRDDSSEKGRIRKSRYLMVYE